jgi:hypothetical protein
MRTELRKETSKSAVTARVKTLLSANLGWLEGFPLEVAGGIVRWMAVPASAPAREMRLEGQHLSRATYALNKLRGELAPALALLPGNSEPEAWLDSVESRLERLKGAVHKGDRLSQRFFQDALFPARFREEASRLAADEPRLKPLLNALSWVHAGHPEQARAALGSVREWGPGFGPLAARLGETPALIAFLRLAQLANDHGRDRVQPLAACLLDERAHDVPLGQAGQICGHILQGLGKRGDSPLPEALPMGGSLGGDLARWCEDLVQQNRPTGRKILRLFELATPLPFVERWADWWHTTRRLLREAQRLRALPYDRESRRGLRLQVERHRKSTPPAFPSEELMEALRVHSAAESSDRLDPLLRVLALLPAGAVAPGRPHFAIYWSLFDEFGPEASAPRITTLLAGFERYLRGLSQAPRPDTAWLEPWATLSEAPASYWSALEYEMVTEILANRRPRRTVLAAYDHLAAVAVRHGGLALDAATRAVELFFLAGDSDLAAAFFDSLHVKGNFKSYLSRASAGLALRLCRERPERFADVLAALIGQEDREGLHLSDWPEPILDPLSTGAVGETVREAVVARQLDRLLACGTKSVLLEAAGIEPPLPIPGEAAAPLWIERYPQDLHAEIGRLAGLLEDAEARVAHWLAAEFPDTQRLEREIQAIEQRLPGADPERQPALRTRLANLRTRLEQPPALGPARLERLRARLGRAWGRAVLDRWEGELDTRLPGALRQLLGIEEVPPWLRENRNLSLLAAATRLPDHHRQLAYRLFRLRCGPPPWDLRDAPQNRRFLESLPHLDWSPWIDGVGTLPVATANGRTLHLALEDDPLEVFLMGAHFQTCLSPGAMNYFSVFANSADLNKRVLYARDGEGKILGRCLLALTGKGELLIFEPYCHDGKLGFEEICADFAAQLAHRMGTVRVSRGKVPTLVASKWYDDGPRDLGRSHPALEEGSPLRRRLATLRPDELFGELRRALKPARLDEATLPLVLALPELQDRPALAVPLLRPAAECRTLPDGALVTAAHLATQAGAAGLVHRLLLQPLIEHLRRGYQGGHARCDYRAINLLLRFDPARLLALLRQTRDRSVRDWLDEPNLSRLEDVALALETLHRPRQAQTLWRHLAGLYTDEDLRQRAQAAIERLEKKAS